jgi:hypothetical protein
VDKLFSAEDTSKAARSISEQINDVLVEICREIEDSDFPIVLQIIILSYSTSLIQV